MAEYIEREALNVAIHESWRSNPHNNPIARQTHNHEHRHFLSLLHKQPAADVVEVVRCKDCAVPHNKWLGCPNLNGLIPPPDFYCAKGERKGAKMDGKGEGE
jgi:hypothetical protein